MEINETAAKSILEVIASVDGEGMIISPEATRTMFAIFDAFPALQKTDFQYLMEDEYLCKQRLR